MHTKMPEKAEMLQKLKTAGFDVPDFIYVSAQDFRENRLEKLDDFLKSHRESFKVIARSAHPLEHLYKGGTFDSLETYADLAGIQYARNRMLKLAKSSKRLSILRQQKFNAAPELQLDELGVIVMPFIEGSSVMAKIIGAEWEFGYCRDRIHKIQSEPFITKTPHDRRLIQLSDNVQNCLGHRCEIEYIVAADGKIHLVQAKDISNIETLEQKESERSVRLDGLYRIRTRRNYRERPIYVMDNRHFYIDLITMCEDTCQKHQKADSNIDNIFSFISDYQSEMEAFALRHQRFAILGLYIHVADDLQQVANHCMDDFPDLQENLSKALNDMHYWIDIFLSEADTLIAKNKHRINLCSHDAYGINTVRNPVWSVYWNSEGHRQIVREFQRLGFKTGDSVGIDIDNNGIPTVIRL